MSLAKIAVSVVAWFESEEGRSITAEEGISWNNEEIGNKVFGWQKSYFYKVLKAGKLDESIVNEFVAQCDEADRNGLNPDRSLAGLLKWTRAGGNESEAGGNGEDGESEEGENETPAVEIRPETILTFTFKPNDGKNVAIRVNSNGEIKTTNRKAEIENAIIVLNALILELN